MKPHTSPETTPTLTPNLTPDQYTGILVSEFVNSEDFKRVTSTFTRELLKKWAGESGFKKKIAPSIEKRINKSLFGSGNGTTLLAPTSATPQFPTTLIDPIIALINDMMDRVDQMVMAVEEMPDAEKAALFEKFSNAVDVNRMTALVGPIVKLLLDNIDLASIKEYLIKAQDNLDGVTERVNETIQQSSDKLLEILELIPLVLNLYTKSMSGILGPLSKRSADDITDTFLHLLGKLDGESLGALLNAQANINRKIMQGTAELRDPTSDLPSSENPLMSKLEEVAGKMDPSLIFNLRLKLEDMKVPLREWLMSD